MLFNANQLPNLRTVNPQVPGSSPGRGANEYKGLRENVTPFHLVITEGITEGLRNSGKLTRHCHSGGIY